MSNVTKVVVGTVVSVFALVVIVGVMSYISEYNSGNRFEQQIKAEYENNQNILGQYTLKVGEAAQIPMMYRDDLKDIITSALSARYGESGSQAMFQWIREQNPKVDATVYTKIQQIIEGGRDQFQNAQTRLIDVKRSYETNLGYFWSGMWMRIAGYPKITLSDYNIVVASDTKEVFKRGAQAPITIRPVGRGVE
jgi:hypothetical protein